MRRFTVPEKTFLKDFILRNFNFQFNENVLTEECDICSIEPQGGFALGYEVTKLCQVGTFKLKVFVSLSDSDNLSPFVLKVSEPFTDTELGDEFFVATGTIDTAHHDYENYSFLPLRYEDCGSNFLNLADDSNILLTDLNPISLS